MTCPKCQAGSVPDTPFCQKCGFRMRPSIAPKKLRKGLAVASLVLGIIGIPTLGLALVGALTGITLAAIALYKIKNEPRFYGGKGIAIAGLILNCLVFVMLPFVGIIAAVAIPNLLRAKMAANEAAAISRLRRLTSAEATYQAKSGRYGSFDELVKAGLVPPAQSQPVQYGYRFEVQSDSELSFEITATPVDYSSSARRSFFINEQGVLRGADKQGMKATGDDPVFTGAHREQQDAGISRGLRAHLSGL